jgi:hypothetical protein
MKIYAINSQYQNYQNKPAFKGKFADPDLDALFNKLGCVIKNKIERPGSSAKNIQEIRQATSTMIDNWGVNEQLKNIKAKYEVLLLFAKNISERKKVLQECENELRPYIKK